MKSIILEGKVVPVKLGTFHKTRRVYAGTEGIYQRYVVDTLWKKQHGRCEVRGCHRLEKDNFEIDHILEKHEKESCDKFNRDWIDNLQLLCSKHHKWKTNCGMFIRGFLLNNIMYPYDAKAQSLLIVRLRVGEVIWDEVSHVLSDGAIGIRALSLKQKIRTIKSSIKNTKKNNEKLKEELKSVNDRDLAATLYQFRYKNPPYAQLQRYESMTEEEFQKEREESEMYGKQTRVSAQRDKLIARVPRAVNYLQKELNKVKTLSLMHW